MFWTGGWDSTFQLLRLLLEYRVKVTPFYLLQAVRRSTSIEIQTMNRIRDTLQQEYPRTKELFLPTRYSKVEDIPPDQEIDKAFHSIIKRKFMGDQYNWIPRYCKHNDIQDMQLSVHRDDTAHYVVEDFVRREHDGCMSFYRIDPKFRSRDEHTLFRYFTFPMLDFEKVQMGKIATEKGWGKIMHMTWFCHKPKRMQPCGVCNPCIYTIKEGLAYRIPLKNRLKSFFFRPIKSLAKAFINKV